jgi:hypothetical protein
MHLGLNRLKDRYKFCELMGLSFILLACLLPDGQYAGANRHGAPPYLAAVRQL